MNDKDPFRNPIQWFAHACLLLLFGAVALSVAIDLLSEVWPWLLGIGLVAGAVVVGVAVWRARRQPW